MLYTIKLFKQWARESKLTPRIWLNWLRTSKVKKTKCIFCCCSNRFCSRERNKEVPRTRKPSLAVSKLWGSRIEGKSATNFLTVWKQAHPELQGRRGRWGKNREEVNKRLSPFAISAMNTLNNKVVRTWRERKVTILFPSWDSIRGKHADCNNPRVVLTQWQDLLSFKALMRNRTEVLARFCCRNSNLRPEPILETWQQWTVGFWEGFSIELEESGKFILEQI